MKTLIFILVIVVCAVILAAILRARHALRTESVPRYQRKKALLSPAERSFLGVLDQVVGADYRVFGQVRIADVLEPNPLLGIAERRRAFNRISKKHFDFVLCRPGDLSIVCAIELDDRSHERRDRMERDNFVESSCLEAGLPLIRFPAQRTYSAHDVASRIAEALQQPWESDVLRCQPIL